jgi:lipopolysaccharide transport protein LptA
MKSNYISLPCLALTALILFSGIADAAPKKEEAVKTTINASKLEYDIEENVVYLRGNVVVNDAAGRLSADNATVYFKAKDDGKTKKPGSKDDKKAVDNNPQVGDFYRIVALGNVLITSKDRQVKAEKAVWDRKANKIVLTGGPPMVKQGISFISATRIVYNVNNQTCEFYPNPEVVLHPSDSERKKFE